MGCSKPTITHPAEPSPSCRATGPRAGWRTHPRPGRVGAGHLQAEYLAQPRGLAPRHIDRKAASQRHGEAAVDADIHLVNPLQIDNLFATGAEEEVGVELLFESVQRAANQRALAREVQASVVSLRFQEKDVGQPDNPAAV